MVDPNDLPPIGADVRLRHKVTGRVHTLAPKTAAIMVSSGEYERVEAKVAKKQKPDRPERAAKE